MKLTCRPSPCYWLQRIGFFFIGIVVGIVLGITPGLGALIGISQVMTVVWGIKAAPAILLLCAIHATVMTGGSIPTFYFKP